MAAREIGVDSKTSENNSLTMESLLDPQNPYVLTVVLPAAALAALGFKRGAVLWIFAAVAWNIGKRFI